MTQLRNRALLAATSALLVVLACAGLLAAAALVPAPAAVLPFVILTCLACPMAVTAELVHAVARLREPHRRLRDELDRLPETPHPLGY